MTLRIVGLLAVPSIVWAIGCGASEPSRANERASPSPTAADETADDGTDPRATSGSPPATTGVVVPGRLQPILDAHNRLRAAHCAPPLSWSLDLAEQARAWAEHLAADGCNLRHSQSSVGENLAAATATTLSPEGVAELWYSERAEYDFARGGFSIRTGHFTQLAWIDTAHLGCAVATCNGLDLYVCNYDPPGNVRGAYQANVLPPSCRAGQ